MPGMNSGFDHTDLRIAAAFRAALLHQGLIALAIIGAVVVAWLTLRGRRPAGAASKEPPGRRLLRIGFGLLWLFDGILQAQPGMPAGLVPRAIEPTALSSPPWVQHVVNWGGTAWTHHPVQAGTAAVWIQVGLGLWLLSAPHGTLSRLAGLASVGWGLVVWVFGESFGGLFAPGLTWLTGAPGAVLVYVVAGALIALPARAWLSPRTGQLTQGGLGLFLAVMAGVQARPGTGFWQGGPSGTLASMVRSMAQTPQPGFLSGGRAHGHRRRVPVRPPAADPARPGGVDAAVPGRLGASPGPGFPRRHRHRSQQHDPVHPAGGRRLPGADPRPGKPSSRRGPAHAGRTVLVSRFGDA